MARKTPTRPTNAPSADSSISDGAIKIPNLGFGSLNRIDNIDDRVNIDPYNDNFFSTVSEFMDRQMQDNVFKGTNGPFKAIVLRVESVNLSEEQRSKREGLKRILGASDSEIDSVMGELGQPSLRIKARIPELHAALPMPSDLEINNEKKALSEKKVGQGKRSSIDFYPTFVAESEKVSKEDIPEIGEVVWVDFQNMEGMTGGIYIGRINDRPSVVTVSSPSSPSKTLYSNEVKSGVAVPTGRIETLQKNVDVEKRFNESKEDRTYIKDYHWKYIPCSIGESSAIANIALIVPHFKYFAPGSAGYKSGYNPQNTVAWDGIGKGGTELNLLTSKYRKSSDKQLIESARLIRLENQRFTNSFYSSRISEYSYGFAVVHDVLDKLSKYFNIYVCRKDFGREYAQMRNFINEKDRNVDLAVSFHINGSRAGTPGTTMLTTSKYNGDEFIRLSGELASVMSSNAMLALGTKPHRRAVLRLPLDQTRASWMFARWDNVKAFIITESVNVAHAEDVYKALKNYDRYVKSIADSIMTFYKNNRSDQYNTFFNTYSDNKYEYGF